MANYYNLFDEGNQKFNDTIHLNGPAPLDDRVAFSDVKGLYFTHGDKNHPLYDRAYKGMQITVFDGPASLLMILNDATPYSANNTTVNVTADNYLNYWAIMSGSEYKLVKSATANTGMFATYKLAFKSPNMKEFQNLEDTVIDIPKDYVVKDVHQCKASYDSVTDTYTETSFPKDGAIWIADTNPVYIHIEWQTKDSETVTKHTYLKVSDIIKIDLGPLDTSVNALERRAGVLDSSVSSLETRSVVWDSSINTLEDSVDDILDTISSNEIFFNGGNTPATVATLTAHGNLEAGTTIDSLSKKTISDILKLILFETATPTETTHPSASISWKSGKYDNSHYVDVGDVYPTADQFVQGHQNAISTWTTKDGTRTGGSTNLTSYNSSILYYADNNAFNSSVNMRSASYVATNHKVKYGDNGYFCSVVKFDAADDAVDSLGSTTKADGSKYIAGYATTKKSGTLTFKGSYRIFSNANVITTTDFNTSGTKGEAPSPNTFKGNDASTMASFFATPNKTFYLKWTGNRDVAASKYYVYVPSNSSVTNIKEANPMTTAYDGDVNYSYVGDVSLNNTFVESKYKKYLITYDGGVLDVRVTIS